MSDTPSSSKSAWVQLYEARRLTGPAKMRLPGRPPSAIPRRKVGLTLSQGEIVELEAWQERLSNLLDRKLSAGETAGILVRICTARLSHLPADRHFDSLESLVEWMIGKEK
jgi:hypothetical protein